MKEILKILGFVMISDENEIFYSLAENDIICSILIDRKTNYHFIHIKGELKNKVELFPRSEEEVVEYLLLFFKSRLRDIKIDQICPS